MCAIMMTEKLIELVRKHPCLYNMKENTYKNIAVKAKLWEEIGKEINETGEVARKKWKSLRDNYMRHKKEVAGSTGQAAKKYMKWPWASQLHFLDVTLTDRERSSNVRQSTPETSSPDTYSTGTPSPPPQTPPPQIPPPDTPPHETPSREAPPHETPLREALPQETPPPEMSPGLTRVRSRARKRSDSEMDKVINFLQNKKKQEYDAIDHLFLSYAQTFKTFSKQNQVKAKLELAKLFANIETDEIQENVQMLNSSPQYSFINYEESPSHESGPEDLSPVIIDLSYIGDTTSNQQCSASQHNEINIGASTSTNFHNDNDINMYLIKK